MPKILDFENKREYFRMRLDSRRSFHRLMMSVRRDSIFSDSYNAIISRTPDELRVSSKFLQKIFQF